MIAVYILLVLMIIIWSLSFVVVDMAIEFTTPTALALYRFILASLSFLIIDVVIKLRNRKVLNEKDTVREKIKLTKFEWLLILIASFSGASIFFFAQYTAIALIGPSLPALFVCLLAPIFIALLSIFVFKEKLDKLKIIGFIIATIGGFLLITGGDIRTLTPESSLFLGYLLALMTPLLWAIFSITMKKLSKTEKISDLQILKYVSYLGTVELLIFVILLNEFEIFIENVLNLFVFLTALYLGLGCYILGYYIWQNSQNKLKSSKVASFLYAEPFLTLLFSLLFQRAETIVLWNILGGIIVLIAVIIINYK